MIFLHLITLAGSLFLTLGTEYLFSLELSIFTRICSTIVFIVANYELLQALNIPDKVIQKEVERDFAKYKDIYMKDLEQVDRKIEFKTAFETDEEKEIKKNNSDELSNYMKKYKATQESFKSKDKASMDDFELMHFYADRLRKIHKLTKFPVVLILFIAGFLTIFINYMSFTTVILISLPGILLFAALLVVYKKLHRKAQNLRKTVEPKSVTNMLEEFENLF